METNNIKDERSEKTPKIIIWSIIIAIIIVTNLFFNYAISLVYTEPLYDKYCPAEMFSRNYSTQNQCVANGGMWSENTVPVEVVSPTDKTSQKITGYCNASYTCQKTFEADNKVYERNVFIILVSLGVLILLVGAFVNVGLLSIAFSWSGVLSLFIASVRYWSSADNLIRVVILGLALAILIWLAVKKFNK